MVSLFWVLERKVLLSGGCGFFVGGVSDVNGRSASAMLIVQLVYKQKSARNRIKQMYSELLKENMAP